MARTNNKHERTLKMIEEAPKMFREGHTVREVADVFHLSDWTVYHYLDQIAEKIGTSREQLLINPVTRYAAPKMGRREDPFDINSFRNKMEEAMTCLLMVKKDLNYIIEVNEKYLQEIERGTI